MEAQRNGAISNPGSLNQRQLIVLFVRPINQGKNWFVRRFGVSLGFEFTCFM